MTDSTATFEEFASGNCKVYDALFDVLCYRLPFTRSRGHTLRPGVRDGTAGNFHMSEVRLGSLGKSSSPSRPDCQTHRCPFKEKAEFG